MRQRVRSWLNAYDGNGDGPRWRQIADTLAIWAMMAVCLAGFVAVCWVIAAAKQGHW